ncbi:MAG: TonB-dependent receptor [Prevotellaceae bacterium]|nr:TonB-dependent receptor [Prevotellaceae bacterium]
MMKQVKFTLPLRMLAIVFGLILSASAFAQITVNGHVKDGTGEDIIGATVRVAGQDGGVVTDFDGNFTIQANQGATLTVAYIGYETATVTAAPQVEVTLHEESAQSLNEIVVIGYGVAKKSDLTGSVTAMKPDSKNKGLVVNAQDMMQGKIAGVNVNTNDGTPGGGAKIRIRGGSSLSGSNDPLIVIDGMAMDNAGVKGLSNLLSMVNPQDIESFNVLKDASATAIYGSRGSNGVIIITTKKGRKGMKPQVSYSGSVTMSHNKGKIDVMTGDEYRQFIHNLYDGDPNYENAVNALGTANTDWQDLIFRTAFSHDHNVTVSGATKNLPYRVSLGYTDQEGTLKNSDFQRVTAAINLNPSLLNDHLNLNLNGKGMYAHSTYADGGAVGAAVAYDPTQSPYAYTSKYHNDMFAADGTNAADVLKNFGGYFQWVSNGSALKDDTYKYTYNNLAPKNPLDMLNSRDDRANSYAFIGTAEVDYKVHGFEDLRLHMTGGADISYGKQNTDVSPYSANAIYYGSYGWEDIKKRNLSFNAYAQYYKDFAKTQHFDIMGGYEWQHFWRETNNAYTGYYRPTYNDSSLAGKEHEPSTYLYRTESYLVSFFGRMNYTAFDRYMLTATVRRDGTSRFKNHWSTFPSAAFAWKINNEPFLKNANWLSDMKLRLGWGMTGQQEGVGDYCWIATYSKNHGNGSLYPIFGDGSLYRPDNFTPELKWETTTTYNVGFDFGVLNQRLAFSADAYLRKTTDLLNHAPAPIMTAFRNKCWQNIGDLKNLGVEFAIDWKAIQTENWFWTLNYNITYNHNEITDLTGVSDNGQPVETGPNMGGGTGNYGMANQVGYPANSFYVYQQVYDENGLPIENMVVDRDGDGTITSSDRYLYKQIAAPLTMGFSSRLEYKGWDFGFSWRAAFGNYVYNNVEQSYSNVSKSSVWTSSNYMANRMPIVLDKNFQTDEMQAKLTDYYVQNASFIKLDNITLGYSFNNLFKGGSYKGLNGRIYGTVNNVLTFTNYKGLDPECPSGVDSNAYPRPFSVIVGLNLNF